MKYTGENLKEISFPIGGIGTGSIGLAGNGRLTDWEIFNRPDKGSINEYSHIAIRALKSNGEIIAKVLNGDIQKDLMGQYSKEIFTGYGYGPKSATMCGFPHFEKCEFTGEFPIAKIQFEESTFPAEISLVSFNPLIPLDYENSSIPSAFFEIQITNNTKETIEYETAFSVRNPFKVSKNTALNDKNYAMVNLVYDGIDKNEPEYGDLTIACDCNNTVTQSYWYRGGWQDGIAKFWNEFSSVAGIKERDYPDSGSHDICTVFAKVKIGPDEKKVVRYVLSWNIPNNFNYWSPLIDENGKNVTWKNYYATVFDDSVKTAIYCLDNWDSLYDRTLKFKESLYNSSIDQNVIEAVSANLSVLKSPTVLRLEDGSFYGWEGVHEKAGSCEGTCTHVWNYAYALCFLFPKLERSIRENEFKYSTYESGEMDFRMVLPRGREKKKFRACLDGQMGSVIKSYREWKISGDDNWLKENWKTIEKILEFAWSPENEDEWDKNKDGVLEGRQHHTLDMELFGPSAWLQGFYLAALKAGSEMAKYLGYKEKSQEYMNIFDKGYNWTKDNLFNGKYFIHSVDIKDKSILEHFKCSETYWNKEEEELKYQIGQGCSIDQLCARWHGNICGIEDIFDKKQVDIAIQSLYRNNFKKSMRQFSNPWRIYSLNDESGSIICDYPEGTKKPAIPIPYCEESMHGFEYQLAGLLISENMVKEGIELVKSVRERYDGRKRNPWNEMECGSNYARSMASFALLPIFSGFKFDLPNKTIGFNPVGNPDNFKCLWSIDSGWGNFELNKGKIRIIVEEGFLEINKLDLKCISSVENVIIDGENINFKYNCGLLTFEGTCIKKSLEIN